MTTNSTKPQRKHSRQAPSLCPLPVACLLFISFLSLCSFFSLVCFSFLPSSFPVLPSLHRVSAVWSVFPGNAGNHHKNFAFGQVLCIFIRKFIHRVCPLVRYPMFSIQFGFEYIIASLTKEASNLNIFKTFGVAKTLVNNFQISRRLFVLYIRVLVCS